MKTLRSGLTGLLFFGLFFALVPYSASQTPPPATSSAATTGGGNQEQVSPDEARKRADWNDNMMRKAAPKKGCFNAAYPSTEWKETVCVKSPNLPATPRRGPRPAVVGNSNDIAAQAPSGHITQAIGHFENVNNVNSESGKIANAGAAISNAYTLQINTDFFTGSTACSGSPNPGCQGWEQWVYWNTGPGNGSASMQYWLIGYNANCPAGQGWNQVAILGTSCWKNSSNAVSVPSQAITNMGNWTLTGTATSSGDSITMSTGTQAYTASGDNVVAASSAWTIAEFNIFGPGGDNSGNGSIANFNAGASSQTRTRIIYGGTAAPNCVAQGFTAEKNNMSFGPNPPSATAPGPAVVFQQSIAGGATSDCAAASTIGDTHLRTFGGLFYDFQASGDFTLAEVDRSFTVQTRQVSGAPTWPNATVNKAVAARFGTTEVAVCLANPGNDRGPGIHVNGKLTLVDDGQTLELPGGVGITRTGSVYQLTSDSGDSVRATMHPTWMDVDVGLGRWPSAVRGLIANPKGNVNQIAARDGTVLTSPFNFDELYHRFADSWRVSGDGSMLSVCGGGSEGEAGIPERTFYASDLEPGVREKAQGVCTAAGVKPGALFDACTLDVAVIGQDEAAKVFVDAIPPVAVGTVSGAGGIGGLGGGFLGTWWWLLLLLIALILLLWLFIRRKH